MSELDVFIETCTNGVHPETVTAIIELVTGRDPFVLTVLSADGNRISASANNRRDAIRKSIEYIEAENPISVGLMQVSDRYWLEYEVTVMDMLEPCTNIRVGTTILKREYLNAVKDVGASNDAMRIALSKYFELNQYGDGEGYTTRLLGVKSTSSVIDKRSWSAEIRVKGFGIDE